jgi:hypothetical protein
VRRRVGERMISACVVPTVKHGGEGVWFPPWSMEEVCGSHREARRRRCDGALLVTLSVIYFDEFKAHLTSMVTVSRPSWGTES